MLTAAFRAFDDILSPEFRSILWTAIGLTLLLFGATIVGTVTLLETMKLVPWGWAETLIEVAASLGIVVLAIFLMVPVTSFFAGFFLDRVAGLVERKDYPRDPPGHELSFARAIVIAIRFGLLVLALNILLLPSFFFGIGAITMLVANAYLLGRQYFEFAAMRFQPPYDAKAMRKANAAYVFLAGLVIAAFVSIPIVNFATPVFAMAFMVHIHKRVAGKREELIEGVR